MNFVLAARLLVFKIFEMLLVLSHPFNTITVRFPIFLCTPQIEYFQNTDIIELIINLKGKKCNMLYKNKARNITLFDLQKIKCK